METLASNTASSASKYTRFRACVECRRRKIKCDGRVEGCRHCQNAFAHCVYSNPAKIGRKHVTSSKKPGEHREGLESVVNLEERLERVEHAVKEHLASRLPSTPPDTRDLDTRRGESSEDFAKPPNPNPPRLKQTALYLWKVSSLEPSIKGADGGLITDFQGNRRFIGESSVFALFLPRGKQWICEKVGEPYRDRLSWAAVIEWNQNPPDGIPANSLDEYQSHTCLYQGEDAPLPARNVVRKYVNEYFDRINSAMPIFSRGRFEMELTMFYQNASRASPAWLLALYVILALGCLSNPLEEPASVRKANETQAQAFFRTGYRNAPKVLFFNRDISGVQALLATVMFLWETRSMGGCFTLLGAASCIGTEIGLHCCENQLNLDPQEVELRRNVFWTAYILDKDLSLRVGRSPSIADNDVGVKLPQGDTEGCNPRLFYHRARLAMILSRVSRLLCSKVSATLPKNALMGTIKILDAELEEWKQGCELMEKDEETLGSVEATAAQHNLRLRLEYYSCLGAIKRPLCPAFDLQEAPETESQVLSEDFGSCLFSARASIRLIDYFERRNLKLQRSTVIHLIAAAAILFVNVLENPLSESSQDDLGYLKRVSDYLRAAVEKGCPNINEMLFLSFELHSMAAQTVSRLHSGV